MTNRYYKLYIYNNARLLSPLCLRPDEILVYFSISSSSTSRIEKNQENAYIWFGKFVRRRDQQQFLHRVFFNLLEFCFIVNGRWGKKIIMKTYGENDEGERKRRKIT